MNTKDRAADKRLQKTYGITLADYNRMFKALGGVCAICGRKPKKLRLSVDHNHATGKVRNLLCVMCNRRILGWIERLKVKPMDIHNYLVKYDPDNPLVKGVNAISKQKSKK